MGLFDRIGKKKEPASEVKSKPVETKSNELEPIKVGYHLGFKLPPKIEKNPDELTELDKIIIQENEFVKKYGIFGKYRGSEQAEEELRKLNAIKKDYLKRNPKEYKIRACELYGYYWSMSEELPYEEQGILEMVGKGLYYEDILEDYEKAIEIYQETYNHCSVILKDEIEKLVRENGDGEYLYNGKLSSKIKICEIKLHRAKIKELEAEAKELEETNPLEAINKYGELNKLNPNLKKYNKRIAKIVEKMAKDMEETDPQGAIKLYDKLNEIDPGLKKYNKRIEILNRRLE